MRSFLAALLAASAFAGVNYLIDEDSEMTSLTDFDTDGDSEDYTWVAEELTLNTSDDGTDITFCFEPTDDTWDEDTNTAAIFGVAWTDGVEYEDGDDTDAVVVYGLYSESAWTWTVFDDIDEAVAERNESDAGTQSTVWELDDENTDWACTDDDVCSGEICVIRSLDAEEDDDYDLPFADGSEFIAYFEFIAFSGIVYSGAMSLGLALFSAAGAALTLM